MSKLRFLGCGPGAGAGRASLLAVVALAALVVLAACPKSPEPASPPNPSRRSISNAEPETWAEHMRHHYTMAADLRDAVVNGDLDDARELAGRMVEHPTAVGMPEPWLPYVQALRTAAVEVAEAPDLRAAAMASARMSAGCGDCHNAVGAQPAATETGPLPTGDHIAEHMMRHRWAVVRMWEGLVQPSDEQWRAGAEALANDSVVADLTSTGMVENLPIITSMEEAVHALGTAALSMGADGTERRAAFGELSATCAECHRIMNWEPDVTP